MVRVLGKRRRMGVSVAAEEDVLGMKEDEGVEFKL